MYAVVNHLHLSIRVDQIVKERRRASRSVSAIVAYFRRGSFRAVPDFAKGKRCNVTRTRPNHGK